MVINIGVLKDKDDELVECDICVVVDVVKGKVLVKVIIEICLLIDEEKVCVCEIVVKVGIDFVKIFIGFFIGGVIVEDIVLMCKIVGLNIGVKVFGGVCMKEDVEKMIEVGVICIGVSVGVVIVFGEKLVKLDNY